MKKYMSTTWLEYVLLLLLFTCVPWILHIADPRPILTFPSFQAWYFVLILPLLARDKCDDNMDDKPAEPEDAVVGRTNPE